MKIFFSTIMVVLITVLVSAHAQQISDEVLPEAETALAIKFEALSPDVADFACGEG